MNWLIEFLFPRRLHRVAYGLRVLTSNITLLLLYGNNWLMDPRLCVGLMILLGIYTLFFIGLPRIRDIGMKWLWILVCFIPVANIVLGLILLFRAPNYHFGESIAVVETKT